MADYLANSLLVPKGGAASGDEAVRIANLRSILKSPAKMSVLRTVLGPDAPKALQRVLDDYDLYNTLAMSRLGAAGSRTTPLAYAVSNIGQPTTALGRSCPARLWIPFWRRPFIRQRRFQPIWRRVLAKP